MNPQSSLKTEKSPYSGDLGVVGVLGAGQMGRGIAQVAAQSGYSVLLVDQTVELATAAKATIQKQLQNLVSKGKLESGKDVEILSRIEPVSDWNRFQGALIVVEAVTESPTTKFSIFSKLGEICGPETLLASNTSSISITEIAGKTRKL